MDAISRRERSEAVQHSSDPVAIVAPGALPAPPGRQQRQFGGKGQDYQSESEVGQGVAPHPRVEHSPNPKGFHPISIRPRFFLVESSCGEPTLGSAYVASQVPPLRRSGSPLGRLGGSMMCCAPCTRPSASAFRSRCPRPRVVTVTNEISHSNCNHRAACRWASERRCAIRAWDDGSESSEGAAGCLAELGRAEFGRSPRGNVAT